MVTAAREAPCVDCGISLPPQCMDLDHVRGEKAFGLARAPWARLLPGFADRLEMVAAEIAKCDVRCPNCHRLRHHRSRNKSAAH